MKIHIVTLGQRLPEWVQQATSEYTKRLPRDWTVCWHDLKAEPRRAGRTTAQILELEARRIEAQLEPEGFRYVLDERGQLCTTVDLANSLEQNRQHGQPPCFVVGSADGLHARIGAQAHTLLSLSRLTLPHALVRILLAEQLYRCHTLLQGHPYHRP